MSLDALSALGDTLPADAPKPESPKLKPKDIVSVRVKLHPSIKFTAFDNLFFFPPVILFSFSMYRRAK